MTEFLKSAGSAAEKGMAVLCVALMRTGKAAREAWRNRKALAPVVGRYAIVFILGMLLSVLMLRTKDAKEHRDEPIIPRESTVAAEVAAEPAPVDPEEARAAELDAINQAAIRREAQYMARVLYGTARYHSKATQEAVCWCIINRVESSLFPNSVEEVCSQRVQWVGYSSNNPVTQELYDVAMSVLETWHDKGIRMIPQDYLYLSWSEDEIVLRTSFNETARTHYWHVNN